MSQEHSQTPDYNTGQELGFYTDEDGDRAYMVTTVPVDPEKGNVTGVSVEVQSPDDPSVDLPTQDEEPLREPSTPFDLNSDDTSASGFEVESLASGSDTVPAADVPGSIPEHRKLRASGDSPAKIGRFTLAAATGSGPRTSPLSKMRDMLGKYNEQRNIRQTREALQASESFQGLMGVVDDVTKRAFPKIKDLIPKSIRGTSPKGRTTERGSYSYMTTAHSNLDGYYERYLTISKTGGEDKDKEPSITFTPRSVSVSYVGERGERVSVRVSHEGDLSRIRRKNDKEINPEPITDPEDIQQSLQLVSSVIAKLQEGGALPKKSSSLTDSGINSLFVGLDLIDPAPKAGTPANPFRPEKR
jgi:hypothetical protein